MKFIFIFFSFCHALNGMNVLREHHKKLKAKKKRQLLTQELQQPVFENEKGEQFYLYVSYAPLPQKAQDYMKKLELKMKEERSREKNQRCRERRRVEKLYQQSSILCLVLGHIASRWCSS